MKISEVSKKFNLSIQTLRYYERIHLIPPVPRDNNGLRNYEESDLYWVHYVEALRNSGVSIKSIQEYVQLVEGGPATRDIRKKILLEQRESLLEKRKSIDIALQHMDKKLADYDEYVIALENNTRRKSASEGK